jgi:hypothetical protein
MRELERENRFEAHNAAVAEEESLVGSLEATTGGGDGASSAAASAAATSKKLAKPEDEVHGMYGGHGAWTPEGVAAASQFALERRTIFDHPRWMIIPPMAMPMRELVHTRLPDEVNVLGGVGRTRSGTIELIA